ncbi:hypothetical protein EGI16_03080 [Chryseobacterium sp. G0240]|uniref:hypothetical protein n=1 Tax=Chryseobacterium sp. G0240 TaxID=2487066 RepID=UPI000F45B3B1|nr:hypothetical protein [Chryseobacterium sp. G0240]ROI06901.1 hypothetical protein EGI16_03080 [Chryseobacterium sp. G0240]
MTCIDYHKESKRIYLLKDGALSVFNIRPELITRIKLDFSFSLLEKITFFKYSEKEQSFEIVGRDGKKVCYFKFDLNGKVVSEKILSASTKDLLLRLNDHNIIEQVYFDTQFSYQPDCIFFENNKEFLHINLLDLCENEEKDWIDYEYIESLKSTNQPYQLAFIAVHVTYGVQGVKVFQIDTSSQLELKYEMDDLELKGAFHHLAFNTTGEKFTLLLYERDHNLTDYFSICEYSVKASGKPERIHKTRHGYWSFDQIHTHYITDNILGIVRNSDIIIFDLTNSTTIEIIPPDLNSAWYIDFNIIIYQSDSKMIVLEY